MKPLLLVAVMVLVSLVGMVGFSRAAELQNIQKSVCPVIECIEFSVLQSTTNQNTGALTELLEPVNARVPARAKMYYLTITGITGSNAITACDSGFHMASISEFQDPGNLQYATRPTPEHDSPYDSPVYDQGLDQYPAHTGWVRTGVDPLAGLVDDCDIWRSSSDQRHGTMMTCSSLWGETGLLYESNPAAWWQSTRLASCSQPESVWCIEDPA